MSKKVLGAVFVLVVVALCCHAQLTVFPASGGGSGATTVAGLSDAGTAAYSNSAAFAPAQTSTIVTQNNSFALMLSNTVKLDAASALSLSNATASRIAIFGADKTVGSATASGAVPIDADGSASTFAQVNALAPAYVVTNNNANALVLSNTVKLDAAHALSLSNLTASRVVLSGADNGLASAAASGAVPVDADGSATTFAQVNALAPGTVLTNNQSTATTFSNTVTIDAAHNLAMNGSILGGSASLARFNYFADVNNTKSYFDFTQSGVGIAALNRVPANVNFTVDAASGATSDLQHWRSAAQTAVARVDTNGSFFTTSIASTNGFLMPTNYVASAFAPVAGMVKIVSSNGVLWKVTQLTTNLLSANTP